MSHKGMIEEWRRLHVLNYELESAALLTLCGAFGLRVGGVTRVIGTRATEEQIAPEAPRPGEDHADP